MRKLVFCLGCAIAVLGCSQDTSSVVGTWKSKSAIILFKADQSWSIVGLQFDSGTWQQSGSSITITPSKIKGKSRDDYMKELKTAGGDQMVGLQKIEKAFNPVTLILDPSGQVLKDSSGTIGDLTRQKS